MREIQKKCVAAYRKHKHLGLAGEEVGIPWQTVYWHLKKVGEPVIGSKAKFGSETDKFAERSEKLFEKLVPDAVNQNETQYQAKHDFLLHGVKIEIKASSMRERPNKGWCYSLKKQSSDADFFVCFGYAEDRESVVAAFIFPSELVRGMQTLRVGYHDIQGCVGKWSCYEVSPDEIADFFSHVEQEAA